MPVGGQEINKRCDRAPANERQGTVKSRHAPPVVREASDVRWEEPLPVVPAAACAAPPQAGYGTAQTHTLLQERASSGNGAGGTWASSRTLRGKSQ